MIATIFDLLPLIIPLIILELGMKTYAIIDIHSKKRSVKHFGKTPWTIIVILVSLGWVVYLLIGKEE